MNWLLSSGTAPHLPEMQDSLFHDESTCACVLDKLVRMWLYPFKSVNHQHPGALVSVLMMVQLRQNLCCTFMQLWA